MPTTPCGKPKSRGPSTPLRFKRVLLSPDATDDPADDSQSPPSAHRAPAVACLPDPPVSAPPARHDGKPVPRDASTPAHRPTRCYPPLQDYSLGPARGPPCGHWTEPM